MKSRFPTLQKIFSAMRFSDVGNLSEFNRLLDSIEQKNSAEPKLPINKYDHPRQLVALAVRPLHAGWRMKTN